MFAGTIKQLERQYEYKRNEANKIFIAEKKSLYEKNPRLAELDAEIRKIGIKAAKLSLSSDSSEKLLAKQNLEKELLTYKNEKNST